MDSYSNKNTLDKYNLIDSLYYYFACYSVDRLATIDSIHKYTVDIVLVNEIAFRWCHKL